MLTYAILNIVFMAAVLLLLRRYLPVPLRPWYLMVIILVVLTAVFDNVIIGLDIVSYDPQRILGIYIYKAPVEDFFYALLAVYVVPALWQYYGKQSEGK